MFKRIWESCSAKYWLKDKIDILLITDRTILKEYTDKNPQPALFSPNTDLNR